MKKLGKLNLNEMQDFAPLSPEEQMAMKGGTGGLWLRLIPVAWELAEKIYEVFIGSEEKETTIQIVSPSSSGNSKVGVYGSSYIRLSDGTEIINSDSVIWTNY